jgi:phosphatidylglycerophosphatase C
VKINGTDRQRHILALFDFDGTLTTRDAYPIFIARALPRWRLVLGLLLTWPLIVGYRAGWVSGVFGRAAVAWIGFSSVRCTRVEDTAARFVRETIPSLLRAETFACFRQHIAQGHTVAVVSGSFDLYLRPWCEQQGVNLLCSSLQRSGEHFTGRYSGLQCVGQEKARRVREAFDLSTFTQIYAYGDTADDRQLLALATKRIYRGQEVTDLTVI